MSNIYRFINFGGNEEPRVIDNNEVISKKIEKIKEELEHPEHQAETDGFVPGLNAEVAELPDPEEESAAAQETAEEIIESARAEAERILSVAEDNAKAVKQNADKERMWIIQSSSKEGFDKGYQEAQQQCQEELNRRLQELNQKQQEMEQEVQKQKEEMEPVLVETILDVFSHMTHLLMEDKKDLILAVVNSAFEDIDISKNYLIRVCHDDAVFLKENKDKIVTAVSDVNIEIVEDSLMTKGQCMIDTDMGVFDCSLDGQIDKLMEDIKILSSSGKRQS